MLTPSTNPFTPGMAKVPEAFVGREFEQSVFGKNIQSLISNGVATLPPTLLFGPRGVGKSTLMMWAEAEAKRMGGGEKIDVIYCQDLAELPSISDIPDMVPAGHHPGVAKRLMQKAERPLASLRAPDSGYVTAGGKLGGEGSHVYLNAKGEWESGGGKIDEGGEEAGRIDLRDRLINRCRKKPMLLLVDEAHELPVACKKELMLLACSAYNRNAAFHLMLAGTPSVKSRLGYKGATFLERAREFPLGSLDPETARGAIAAPFINAKITVADDIYEEAVKDSKGYPHFVQTWGWELWELADQHSIKNITLENSAFARDRAKGERMRLYESRYEVISGHEDFAVACYAVASAINSKGPLSRNDLLRAVELSFPDPERARGEKGLDMARLLEAEDFVWMPRTGYVPGIPNFTSYIRENVEERFSHRTTEIDERLVAWIGRDGSEVDL